jgi:glycosyltransferase involved in cell wall biosynthesis
LSAAGGTQRVLTTLANLLVKKYNVSIIVLNKKEPFFNLNKDVNVESIIKDSSNKISSLFQLNLKIYRFLKLMQCDYYISLDSNSVLMQSLCLPRKTKLIVWEHFSLSKNYNKLLYRFSRYYASKRAYQFVLLSKQEIKDWDKQYNIPVKKTNLIYNPVTIEEIHGRNEMDLYANKKVLAIGNNVHVKGFDILLEAWGLLDINGWTLEIVGLSTDELIKAEKNISKYKFQNEVILTGPTTNITAKYTGASIYCLTSRMEATPLVLIESQFIGLPAVIFDNCEGPIELLQDSGIVVNYSNVIKYKEAIESLINSRELFDKFSLNARKNSLRFGHEEFYNNWKDILN